MQHAWLLNDESLVNELLINPIENGLFGAAHGWGAKRPPPFPKILSHISYNDETWHSYTLPKKDPKNMSHVTHPLSSAAPKISKFCYIRNTCIDCILIQKF